MQIIGLIANIIQTIAALPTAAKVVGAFLTAVGLIGAPLHYLPINYEVGEITDKAELDIREAIIWADNVTVNIVGGYCGMTGIYRVQLEAEVSIDIEKIEATQNRLGTWVELKIPEPNLTDIDVEQFDIIKETTSLGCNVDFGEARDLAQYLAKAKFIGTQEFTDLLGGSKDVALDKVISFVKKFPSQVVDGQLYDDDNGNTSNVDIPVQYKCWGLNDGVDGQFVKRC